MQTSARPGERHRRADAVAATPSRQEAVTDKAVTDDAFLEATLALLVEMGGAMEPPKTQPADDEVGVREAAAEAEAKRQAQQTEIDLEQQLWQEAEDERLQRLAEAAARQSREDEEALREAEGLPPCPNGDRARQLDEGLQEAVEGDEGARDEEEEEQGLAPSADGGRKRKRENVRQEGVESEHGEAAAEAQLRRQADERAAAHSASPTAMDHMPSHRSLAIRPARAAFARVAADATEGVAPRSGAPEESRFEGTKSDGPCLGGPGGGDGGSLLRWRPSAEDCDTAVRQVAEWLLVEVFRRHNEAKVREVPALLEKYSRAEVSLVGAVLRSYVAGNAPAESPLPLDQFAELGELLDGLRRRFQVPRGGGPSAFWPELWGILEHRRWSLARKRRCGGQGQSRAAFSITPAVVGHASWAAWAVESGGKRHRLRQKTRLHAKPLPHRQLEDASLTGAEEVSTWLAAFE